MSDSEVQTEAKNVVLTGMNGQGKTNFLEAVYFCSYASSFRAATDTALIKKSEKDCAVQAVLARFPAGEENSTTRVQVKIQNGKKTVHLDGKRLEDRKELLSLVSPIVFCHEDLEFVAGTPERRRWFFDQSICIYDKPYMEELQKYRKILKTRNTLLKEQKAALLEIIDLQLVDCGLKLMEKRKQATEYFSAGFLPLYETVSGLDGVGIRYSASWKNPDKNQILQTLAEKRSLELAYGTSLSGPHRDRYQFIRAGSDFSGTASTGQRRLLALLLRVTQAGQYAQITGKKPVLLLDDVLLELDPEKRKKFLAILPAYEQAFFTFLPEEPYLRYLSGETLILTVHEGKVTP